MRPGCAGLFGAVAALGVKERAGAHHDERDGEVALGLTDADLGEVQADRRRVPHPLGRPRGPVEHPAQRAVAEPRQRERAFAQVALGLIAGAHERAGDVGGGFAHLLGDVGDADIGVAAVGVGGGQARRQSERLGLRERPIEHRPGHGLEQALAHLPGAEAGERVQSRLAPWA